VLLLHHDDQCVNKMVVLTDDEDKKCRLVSVRLIGSAGVDVPRPSEEPRPQLEYRWEREKQRAARRRGSMARAASVPRLRVRWSNLYYVNPRSVM